MAGKTKEQLMTEKLAAFEAGVAAGNRERSLKGFIKEGVLAFALCFSYIAGPLVIASVFLPGLLSVGLRAALGIGLLGFAVHVGSQVKCFVKNKP
jgi:hypothetical protein